jgi:hypothetical protein
MATRNLFGDYITATLPQDIVDLNDDPYGFLATVHVNPLTFTPRSWVQEVPDTQEVFRYTQSDALIIIEVLLKVEPEDGEEPIKSAHNSDSILSLTYLATASSSIQWHPKMPQFPAS